MGASNHTTICHLFFVAVSICLLILQGCHTFKSATLPLAVELVVALASERVVALASEPTDASQHL